MARLIERLDQAMAGEVAAPGEPAVRCLTPLVSQLRQRWEEIPSGERARLTASLAPWKRDLVEPRAPSDGPVPPHSTPCFGETGRYQLQGEHFSVEWDEPDMSRYASDFASWLETAWDEEVDNLGWSEPTSTPEYPILAYIYEDPGYAGAYVSVDHCNGYGWVPYIVAYSGSFSSSSWAKSMAAHEFMHTLQFSLPWMHEIFLWEATAMWVEEQVWPTLDEWAPYIEWYTEVPYIGMNAWTEDYSDAYYHMYGMAVLAFFLDERHGGADTIREIWELSNSVSGSDYSLYLPTALESLGYDWDELYTAFVAANAVMDYDEQELYPQVLLRDEVTRLPASGSSGGRLPQSLGQDFVRFDHSTAEDDRLLEVEFDGQSGVDWFAILVSTEDQHVVETVNIEVDSDGEGTGSIAWADGDSYLVISPWDSDAFGYAYDWDRAGDWSYSWSADIVEPPVEDTQAPEDTHAPSDDTQPPVEDTGPTATDSDAIDDQPIIPDDSGTMLGWSPRMPPRCACSSRPVRAWAWVLLVLSLGLLALHRRGDG